MTWIRSAMCEPWPCLLSDVRLWANHLVSPFLHLLMDCLPSFLSSSEATRDPRLFLGFSELCVSLGFLYILEGEG